MGDFVDNENQEFKELYEAFLFQKVEFIKNERGRWYWVIYNEHTRENDIPEEETQDEYDARVKLNKGPLDTLLIKTYSSLDKCQNAVRHILNKTPCHRGTAYSLAQEAMIWRKNQNR